jgi:hypothetical protein
MVTEGQLLGAIHQGIHTANKNIDAWSGGYNFLTDAAAEGFMVTHIAQEIKTHKKVPPFLLVEPLVKRLREYCDRPPVGRPIPEISKLARVDLAILNRTWELRYVIEAKCCYGWSGAYTRDLRRLMKMKKDFSTMKAGIFAMFVHSHSINGAENAEQNLKKLLGDWENNIRNDINNRHRVDFSYSSFPYNKWTDGKKNGAVHLGTSLCAVIK